MKCPRALYATDESGSVADAVILFGHPSLPSNLWRRLGRHHDLAMTFINGVTRWVIDRFHQSPPPPSIIIQKTYSFAPTIVLTMPALFPVDDFHGDLLIATVLSSIIYGVTWSQVYSYYNVHCSRDRWPLKSFVAFLMLVDSANLVSVIYPTYHLVITNFGDYQSIEYTPWSQAAVALSGVILEVSVQHFYAYRIYCLGWRSLYLPAAISIISLTEFGTGLMYSIKVLTHTHQPGSFKGFFIAALSVKVLCDVLITVGMVYTVLSNRTQVRRTNSVLNLLAIYAVNCGTLHLVFAISCVILFAKPPYTLKYTPSLFIMVRLSLCAFMAILNSRDNLRDTLDGPGGVVTTFTSSRHARVPISWPRKTEFSDG
ncbi:hypothetical protein H4582DRAFT_491935 [Lactarius indigo]|nr:hypothetical protein H4582DRAFT_491935 [Lactarius indigo]